MIYTIFSMWEIFETKTAEKNIDKLPKNVLEKYEFWRNVVQMSGLDGLRQFKGFRDHALKGEWEGYRSSYLNAAYMVIYTFEKNEFKVFIIDVKHHDYRRK